MTFNVLSGTFNCTITRDIVPSLGPWSVVVLKDETRVLGLGLGLGLEGLVFGPVFGLEGQILVNIPDYD